MSGVLVDSNVILDVVTNDPQWEDWSASMLARYAESEMLIINPIIYAEVSVGFDRVEDLDDVLPADSSGEILCLGRQPSWPSVSRGALGPVQVEEELRVPQSAEVRGALEVELDRESASRASI